MVVEKNSRIFGHFPPFCSWVFQGMAGGEIFLPDIFGHFVFGWFLQREDSFDKLRMSGWDIPILIFPFRGSRLHGNDGADGGRLPKLMIIG